MEPKHSLNPFFFLFFPTEILFNFTILLKGPRTLLISQLRNFEDIFHFSGVQLFVTLWTAACQASLFLTISWSLPKFMSIESVIPSNHFIFCHPLLLLPSIFPISESFPMSQLFTSGGQSIGVSASSSVLPLSIWGWFPLGLTLPTLKPKLTLLQLSLYLFIKNLFIWLCWVFRCSTACEILVFWLGMEAMSSVLQGGFLTTGPLGKFIPLFKRFFCGAPWLLLLLSLCPFQLFLLNAIPRTTLKSFCLLVPTL